MMSIAWNDEKDEKKLPIAKLTFFSFSENEERRIKTSFTVLRESVKIK